MVKKVLLNIIIVSLLIFSVASCTAPFNPTVSPSPTASKVSPSTPISTSPPVATSFSGSIVSALAIDPNDSQIFYVASNKDNGGIFKSIDGGVSWVDFATSFSGSIVSALAIDPNDSQIFYACTNKGGVDKSIDGGVSWARQ